MDDTKLEPEAAVVHCKKKPYHVYIGRPSKWGNPFGMIPGLKTPEERARVIKAYEEWLQTQPQLLKALPELKGKVLGCWCYPKPCHGDVLFRLANQ